MNCSVQHSYDELHDRQSILALQPFWDLIRTQEHWIKSPFFPALFSFIVYTAFCLPFIVLDFLSIRVPALRKYKIQPQNSPTLGMLALCITQSIYQHLVCILPVTVAHWYWRPVSLPRMAPELPRLLLDITVCLLLFDFFYFLWHLLHHRVPWLYKTFHKVHHKHTSTFALTTQYSSVWELLWLGLFAAMCPMLLQCHPLTEMTFFIANIWLSVEDHSGYDLPWSTHRLVPFGLYGGAPHHDLHHLKFKFNYAPYFTHWDRVFGTLNHALEESSVPAKRKD
ncbi:cholesterol 25-hydroxylase [Hemicordylus capensis]|uniref:cholesterol 25-hydroxylase n=1 Tax=Hemicordylus capensis TaxID=884348 RepID=UPI0023045DF1|nr:cholesterol 25-hydroxylase [Hemicordylus capensis]